MQIKIRLLLSYKGSHFFGWQKQKCKRTVQGEIEQALFRLFNTPVALTGAGRTDTGVHALEQNAHFVINSNILKNIPLVKALNHFLPKDITILTAWKVPKDFHARFNAEKKTYMYFIWTGNTNPVLFRNLVWWKKTPHFNLKKLQQISSFILGTKNFKSFQSSGTKVNNTIRSIYQSEWNMISPHFYSYNITGSGFLKQMVRNLVGTFIDLLQHQEAIKKLQSIFYSLDRKSALQTAPGQGLYLKHVVYPKSIEKASYPLNTN